MRRLGIFLALLGSSAAASGFPNSADDLLVHKGREYELAGAVPDEAPHHVGGKAGALTIGFGERLVGRGGDVADRVDEGAVEVEDDEAGRSRRLHLGAAHFWSQALPERYPRAHSSSTRAQSSCCTFRPEGWSR